MKSLFVFDDLFLFEVGGERLVVEGRGCIAEEEQRSSVGVLAVTNVVAVSEMKKGDMDNSIAEVAVAEVAVIAEVVVETELRVDN